MNPNKAALHCTRLQTCYCGLCFSVHHGPFGILFSAPVPIEDSCYLMKFYSDNFGYDICDAMIAHHMNCALCLTTKKKSKKWRKELGIDE